MQVEVVVLILLIIVLVYRYMKTHPPKCKCAACSRERLNPRYVQFDEDVISYGLNDIEQDIPVRNRVRIENQPDQIIAKWQCQYSHPGRNEYDELCDDYYGGVVTPMWRGREAFDVAENSNMHLVSRFASQ